MAAVFCCRCARPVSYRAAVHRPSASRLTPITVTATVPKIEIIKEGSVEALAVSFSTTVQACLACNIVSFILH